MTLTEEIDEFKQRYNEIKPPPKVGYVIDYTPSKEEIK
jgi:hypothetical protein